MFECSCIPEFVLLRSFHPFFVRLLVCSFDLFSVRSFVPSFVRVLAFVRLPLFLCRSFARFRNVVCRSFDLGIIRTAHSHTAEKEEKHITLPWPLKVCRHSSESTQQSLTSSAAPTVAITEKRFGPSPWRRQQTCCNSLCVLLCFVSDGS